MSTTGQRPVLPPHCVYTGIKSELLVPPLPAQRQNNDRTVLDCTTNSYSEANSYANRYQEANSYANICSEANSYAGEANRHMDDSRHQRSVFSANTFIRFLKLLNWDLSLGYLC